jgi:hypothetical protein
LVTIGGIIPLVLLAMYYGHRQKVLAKDIQDKKADIGQLMEEAL